MCKLERRSFVAETMDIVRITDTARYGAQKVSAMCVCLIRARQNEPSGVAALL